LMDLTIITWDCVYREFHHLITALEKQQTNASFELLITEQRDKNTSDAFAKNRKVDSLSTRVNRSTIKNKIKLHYMNDIKNPYHVGKINNFSLKHAQGRIIAIMDGDMLLQENFIETLLSQFRNDENQVVNLQRASARRPNKSGFVNWKKQIIEYREILQICPQNERIIPDVIRNKGPMIAATKKNWDKILGYDDSWYFSTAASMVGVDVNTRLEIATDSIAKPLIGQIAVHPYHPVDYNRNTEKLKIFLKNQGDIIKKSLDNEVYDMSDRYPQLPTKLMEQVLNDASMGQFGQQYSHLQSAWIILYNIYRNWMSK
ncbi:glycosyltransferase family 2 protein, partial [Planktomarina temperata]|nr:glycosyltransferase family 2 protein [Planktomarina temperata]